ncbi:hypothetical protein BO94DRAFT_529916 [Aspergillus sclerotioniger CBS 115572]|uniref:Integral membrane protein n=1 Tax=Aspergillus sclerotioniger CBS 115572 TaxID=1450535 RepID=A0A317XDD7_9EURO|nr:hypothetical protein BO94DRAFT_529916 [Aspergillus sclerotioniger CBS 115572]PWY96549.1 hypothetical protein BO94DRAFT_529916 [Aspergillus sclerotioniger CBS 115572]
MDPSEPETSQPPIFNYILSFLLVGVAWGFTTPFIRRAAADFSARQEQQQQSPPTATTTTNQPDNDNDNDNVHLTPITDPINTNTNTTNNDENEEEEEDHTLPPAPATATPQPAWIRNQTSPKSWLRTKLTSIFWTVINLLRTPAYSIPLVVNLTGSVWFFLLVGKHELSLTVPLANSSAFLFTVLGEWYVERKVIEKETWLGMGLVLGGIALCVGSKA